MPATISDLEAHKFEAVTIWPENWRAVDQRTTFSNRFPKAFGVYAFVEGDEVVYIGKAEKQTVVKRVRKYVNTNPKSTRSTAKRVQGSVDDALAEATQISVYFLVLDAREVAWREAAYIDEWQPRWNVQGVGRAR
jgi:excinuclease UvrABC nuclease subunit